MRWFIVLGSVAIIAAGVVAYDWSRTPGAPPHPDPWIVIWRPDGSPVSYGTLPSGASRYEGVVELAEMNGGETITEFRTRSRALPSGSELARYEIYVQAKNGPGVRQIVEYRGAPVSVFQHLGFRVSIEPGRPQQAKSP